MTTAICLPCYLPPHHDTLRVAMRLADLHDWSLLESSLPKGYAHAELMRRAAEAEYDELVWLHPKLHTTADAVGALVETFRTMAGAHVVCGVAGVWETAVLGMWSKNFYPDHDGGIIIGGEASALVECSKCTLEYAVTSADLTPGPELEMTDGRAVFADCRNVAGMWVERPFFPSDARNKS